MKLLLIGLVNNNDKLTTDTHGLTFSLQLQIYRKIFIYQLFVMLVFSIELGLKKRKFYNKAYHCFPNSTVVIKMHAYRHIKTLKRYSGPMNNPLASEKVQTP